MSAVFSNYVEISVHLFYLRINVVAVVEIDFQELKNSNIFLHRKSTPGLFQNLDATPNKE